MKRKRWALYREVERKQKRRYLKGLSERKSVGVLMGLYQWVSRLNKTSRLDPLRKEKIKTLQRIHALCGKVKA